jgi:hypothetical protein
VERRRQGDSGDHSLPVLRLSAFPSFPLVRVLRGEGRVRGRWVGHSFPTRTDVLIGASSMNDIHLQFGTLLEILGKTATHAGFTFVPAAVKLHGSVFSTDFYFRDSAGARPPAILARPIEEQYDAAWVRARLPRVFGFTPEISEAEKSLLDVGFVAVAVGSPVGFPFICSDYYGRTGIMFSPEGPDHDTQAKIAAAFWSLLLKTPDDLADFEAAVYHPGAGVWLHFACKDGEPSCRESQETG